MRKTKVAFICLLLFIGISITSLAFATGISDDAHIEPTPTPEPTPAPVVNQEITIEVMLGYEGLLIMNRWMPTFVTVTNAGADFDGMLGVNVFQTESMYDRYEIPLELANGAKKTIQLPIKPKVRQDMYAFELVANKKTVAETRVKPARLVAPESVSVGILSDDPAALAYIAQRANGLDTLRGETWVTIPLNTDTFPETSDLMDSFTIIVVDGLDIRSLSKAQQDVFTGWLGKGGIVIVSGGAKAAAGYPFFTQWTGLTASKIKEVDDITPSLIKYITKSVDPLEKSFWINAFPKEQAIISTDEDGLVSLSKVGDGLIFTAAFDVGSKPFTEWVAASAFLPRTLRTSSPTFYSTLLDKQDRYRYNNAYYRVNELIRTQKIANTESGIPVLLVLIAYLFTCGVGGYWILKRIDKAIWLWAVAPASAIAFGVVLLLLSNQTTMNEPVAISTSQVSITAGVPQIRSYIGIATPHSGELLIETEESELPTVIKMDDYYNDYGTTSQMVFRPQNMVQRYRYGEKAAIGFASNEAWDPRMISVNVATPKEASIEGSLWIEEDGVHGEITNLTDSILTDCMVITNFGYDMLGDILPGQRAEVALILPKTPVQYSSVNFTYEPGVMYSILDPDPTSAIGTGMPSNMLYEFINAITYDRVNGGYKPDGQKKQYLINLFEEEFSFYQNNPDNYFFGFSDSIGQVGITLNDVPVTRTAHNAVLGAKIAFNPIGPTGFVLFPQGQITGEVIFDMGETEKPRLPTQADGTNSGDNRYLSKEQYIRYGTPVALRYVLPDYDQYTVELLSIGASYYDSIPDFYLYNNVTNQWDKQKTLSLSLKGDDCLPYVDEEGILYARYAPTDSTGRYDSMQMPWLVVKGKVK